MKKNDPSSATYSEPTVLEGMCKVKKTDLAEQCTCVGVIRVHRAAKMLHMWINVTINCFLQERI